MNRMLKEPGNHPKVNFIILYVCYQTMSTVTVHLTLLLMLNLNGS